MSSIYPLKLCIICIKVSKNSDIAIDKILWLPFGTYIRKLHLKSHLIWSYRECHPFAFWWAFSVPSRSMNFNSFIMVNHHIVVVLGIHTGDMLPQVLEYSLLLLLSMSGSGSNRAYFHIHALLSQAVLGSVRSRSFSHDRLSASVFFTSLINLN